MSKLINCYVYSSPKILLNPSLWWRSNPGESELRIFLQNQKDPDVVLAIQSGLQRRFLLKLKQTHSLTWWQETRLNRKFQNKKDFSLTRCNHHHDALVIIIMPNTTIPQSWDSFFIYIHMLLCVQPLQTMNTLYYIYHKILRTHSYLLSTP